VSRRNGVLARAARPTGAGNGCYANPLALDAANNAFVALAPEAAGLPRGEVSARGNPTIAVAVKADP